MNRLLAMPAAALALSAPPVAAQEDAFALDEIVVSGALTALPAQPLNRVGATIDVVEGDALGPSPATPITQALDRVPGLSFTSNGGLGATALPRIRGLPSPYVAVRIDGIDVTDPSGVQTFFDFGGLTTAGIGRIEVIRGSQSALYGSEAIAGVIDISTLRPETLGFSGDLTLEAGSFETYGGSATLSHVTETSRLSFTASRVTSEGISARAGDDERDGFQQTFATFSGEFDVSDTVTLGFAGLWREQDLEIDRSETDNSGESSGEQAGARLFARIDAWGIEHELAWSVFSTDRDDPGGFTTGFEGDRREVTYLGTTDLGSTTLSFGAEWSEESFRTTSAFVDEEGKDETASLLGEAVFRPTEALDIALSLRHDDSDDFGGQTTGRLALAWQATPETTLRASAGTGFRAPSLFERFSSYGDPGLEPEESRSFEIGVERRFAGESFVKATAFYAEVDSLIDFDPNATVCGSGFGCYGQVDGTTTTRGLELSGRYDLAEGRASLFGAYTYTDAETEEGRLPRVPRHDLVLGIEGEIASRLSGRFDVQLARDIEASEFAPPGNKVGDYTLANLQLSYALTDRFDATLRIENLTDEDYETAGGFNQPGRAAYVALTTSF